MARKIMDMKRYAEIKRQLELGVSIRDIARSLKCTRRTIRQIRDEAVSAPNSAPSSSGPLWAERLDWKEILKEVMAGHPLKYLWEEKAGTQVSYVNFWKQFHKQFPSFKQATVVHRFFEPGTHCEVDWAGDTLEWVDLKTGEIHKAYVFVGSLGFSQLIFSCATANMKSRAFLESHQKMYEYFEGVPKVTVPDCLKQGVQTCHLYDPEINSSYQELATHYKSAIVPARPRRPKDKALVEGAVKIVMRYFKFLNRQQTFTSLVQINQALSLTIKKINQKKHSRFKISRRDRFVEHEKPRLQPLPLLAYEHIEWRQAKLHPDSHLSVDSNFYSSPHRLRGKSLQVKLTDCFVEIYDQLERVALHKRSFARTGSFITQPEHLPDNAKAYYENTPQNILSQAKYLNLELFKLLKTLFKQNALGHLRRAQGLVRESQKEFKQMGSEKARSLVERAIQTMNSFNKIRVPYFRELLNLYRLELNQPKISPIQRKPNNPHLRHVQINLH